MEQIEDSGLTYPHFVLQLSSYFSKIITDLLYPPHPTTYHPTTLPTIFKSRVYSVTPVGLWVDRKSSSVESAEDTKSSSLFFKVVATLPMVMYILLPQYLFSLLFSFCSANPSPQTQPTLPPALSALDGAHLAHQADGNLLDASSFAAYTALNTARIPKVTPLLGEGGVYDDFEMSGEIGDAVPIEGTANVPVCLTMSRVRRTFNLTGNIFVVAYMRAWFGVCAKKRSENAVFV